jgi:hypothetical protein
MAKSQVNALTKFVSVESDPDLFVAVLNEPFVDRLDMTLPVCQTKVQLFREFDVRAKRVWSFYKEWDDLLDASIRGAAGFKNYLWTPKDKWPVLAAGADDAVGSIEKVHGTLQRLLSTATVELGGSIYSNCRTNACNCQMGLVNWLADDVMRYHHFRFRTDRVNQYERTETHSLFIHDVINATAVPVAEYERQIPKRVEKVIDKIPSWLMPSFKIADGTEISKTVIEHETRHVVPNLRYDPCLILGPYVFAAWDESETRRMVFLW